MNNWKGYFYSRLMKFFWLFPIQNKVVFQCFDGKAFGDNPKAIFDELIKGNTDVKCVWILNDPTICIDNAKCVGRYSISSLYHLATAKIWVDNSRKRDWVVKRKGQYYIQTWHGGIALKKIEKDAVDSLPLSYINNAISDSNKIDLLISGSDWNTANYRSAFWYDGTILESGLPRSDCFYNNLDTQRNKVYSDFNLEDNDKLALYAPTFRVDGNLKPYLYDFSNVLDSLKNKWGGNWKMIVRLHPNLTNTDYLKTVPNNVIDGSGYSDFNSLIIACDVLITDYSSCMFDAARINRKVFLFASDISNYLDDRGFYFPLTQLPFPLAETIEELRNNIQLFDNERYYDTVKQYMNGFHIFDDGNASKRVVKVISDMLNNQFDEGLFDHDEKK